MADPSIADEPPPAGYRALVDNFPNGILVLFDDQLRHHIVGPATLPVSGRDAEELQGREIEEIFPDETRERIESELEATIAGEERSYDVDFDDRVFHVETAPVRIESEPYGVLVSQEVTQERRTARELERQNERLERFASMVSHDLRNPLAIASGSLELYRETGDESALERVETALDRIDQLTDDLLALAETGTSSGGLEPVSVARAAQAAWDRIDGRSATLETEETTVPGVRAQVETLLENLQRNAIEHGGSDVTVRVGPLEEGFYVEDTGDGISPTRRDDVFDHGYSTGDSGSGVGLSIVEQVAEAHGWEIHLESSAEGGARFEFHGADGGR